MGSARSVTGIVSLDPAAWEASLAITAASADKVNAASVAAFKRKLILTQNNAVSRPGHRARIELILRPVAPRLRVYRFRPPLNEIAATCALAWARL